MAFYCCCGGRAYTSDQFWTFLTLFQKNKFCTPLTNIEKNKTLRQIKTPSVIVDEVSVEQKHQILMRTVGMCQ